MPKMNRRSFLAMLGATATAAVLDPTRALAYPKGTVVQELLVTRYSLLPEGASPVLPVGAMAVTAYILPAPAGRRCRAEICVPDELKRAMAYPRMVMTGNGPAEVAVSRVGRGALNYTVPGDIDATVFNGFGGPLPLDWGLITRGNGIEIDYRSLSEEDEALFLALYFTTHDEGPTLPGCVGWPAPPDDDDDDDDNKE
jgi:hypothetical protein